MLRFSSLCVTRNSQHSASPQAGPATLVMSCTHTHTLHVRRLTNMSRGMVVASFMWTPTRQALPVEYLETHHDTPRRSAPSIEDHGCHVAGSNKEDHSTTSRLSKEQCSEHSWPGGRLDSLRTPISLHVLWVISRYGPSRGYHLGTSE